MLKQEIRIAQGQQRAQSEEGFKNMAHEKKGGENLCSLSPRLNGSIIILLALVIASQHGPG